MFYSIIIPAFKTPHEKIARCLTSLYRGDFRDFEIILVDDGSGEPYAGEMDTLAARYQEVRVYHLSHGGAARARNFGVKQAKGLYVCFVDADDMVTVQFWADMEAYSRSDMDYDVVYGLVRLIKKGTPVDAAACPEEKFCVEAVSGEAYDGLYRQMFDLGSPLFRTSQGYVSRGPVARLVKRTLAVSCTFPEDLVLGEDELWNLKLLERTRHLGFVRHTWYLYIENPVSTSHKPDVRLEQWHRDLLISMLPFLKKGSLEGAFANRVIGSLHEIAMQLYLTPMKKGSFWQKVKEYNAMANSYPYTVISYKYAKMGGVKTLIKYALLKAGLLLVVYKVKMMLRRK